MRDTFWLALGIAFLAAALFVLARFAIGDRARGRRRCPKCWYDMAGGGGACPECGREIRSERELTRSRRRKAWAALAIVLALLGWGSLSTGRAIEHGAVGLVPDWVLVEGMEHWPKGALSKELQRRHWEGELSAREQRRLIARADALLGSRDPQTLTRALTVIRTAEFLGRDEAERHTKPWATWVPASQVSDGRNLVLRLVPLLSHADPSVRDLAVQAIEQFADASAFAFPTSVLLARENPGAFAQISSVPGVFNLDRRPYRGLEDVVSGLDGATPEAARVLEFIGLLREVQFDTDSMHNRLLAGIASDLPQIRLISLWMLRMCFWPDEGARLAALAIYDHDERITAPAIVDFAVSGPLDEPAAEVIRRALRTRDYEQWAWAVERLGERGPGAAQFEPDIRELLGTPQRVMAAIPYAQITGDRETPARALVALTREQEAFGGLSMNRRLGRLGWVDGDVVAMWRAGLASEDPNIRMVAAAALLRNGPPNGFDRAELTRIAGESCIAQWGGLNGKDFGDTIQYAEADIPTVLQILDEHRDLDRSLPVWLLGMAGTKAEAALPWLRRALSDPDPTVAKNAALSIRRIEWCLEHGDPPPEPRDKY